MKEFKKYLQLNYRSTNTISNYYSNVYKYLQYSNNSFTQETFDKYLIEVVSKQQNSTFNSFISAMKVYCEFKNVKLNYPKNRTKVIRSKPYITYNQLNNEIIPYFKDIFVNDKISMVIYETLFFTGLRSQELINLKLEDIDYKNKKYIIKNTKTNLDRCVPVLNRDQTENLIKVLKSGELSGLTYDKIKYVVLKVNENCNFDITPHCLRKSFAIYANQRGFSTSEIQYMLGHVQVQQTIDYLQMDEYQVMEKAKTLI